MICFLTSPLFATEMTAREEVPIGIAYLVLQAADVRDALVIVFG